ncbi:MAG: hypothetical protein HW386_1964 [Gammaproteobacteria bacterium]|nr:hypothetical protein [Gammaproteobacteria bacterium]
MIDIVPNWHPVFVHFTVALLSLTVCFHLLGRFMPAGSLKKQFETLADWNLWLGTGFGIITALAGWMAYNSVTHDAPSHVAMTDHRNWAWATLTLFMILSVYSLWCASNQSRGGAIFLGILLLAGLMLGSTAWRGAEVVYRHGIGVMSLPQPEAIGHDHASHDQSAPVDVDHDAKVPPSPEAADHHDHDMQMHQETDEMHEATGSQVPEDTAANHDHEDHVH